ncbi:4Fe-4S double cluster binding domain-containing protein [Acetobacterium tundrae]|uniref:Epoxyqueuosine reductase n=1 Tax=Acetobacterium tundrae TaxID=132932 RepID=A0ABR6WQA8_9FIRM|nr:4Fe-4S double cluster binding domain-containing protein [Acetobacterium tundrae]MBC3798441.1 epoxyqueuosine reductase [Acetobacterium tundrae]
MKELIKDDKNFNDSITTLGKSLGSTQLSFSDITILPENKRMGFIHAITIIVRLSEGILNQIEDEPTQTYFSHYRSVNRLIDQISLRISLFLEEMGYPSVAIPASQSVSDLDDAFTGAFQHKTGAVLSGLGWIGRSALFIHENYGPRVRMGTVLTNAPLQVGIPITQSSCGSCRSCVTACPAMAIEGRLWKMGTPRNELYDAFSCSQYMKEVFQHIGRGAVCGLCMVACPVGKKIAAPKD